ncbi:MAG TPA: PIG-L family deacetylase [Solirubrobacteraceae bacterium]|nr:PIG-L family deacetylase [Solirubrobacteraceae bacterium]
MLSRLQSIPRGLYRRSKQRLAAREESRFTPRLRVDAAAPELVLSPHFDDAVLNCWTILSDERELNVANVFAAAPAPGRVTLWDATTGASDSAQRVRERVAEDAAALGRAGRKPINLSFMDAQYRRPPQPTLEAIDHELSANVPSASRVYVPAGIGSHPDHLLTRRYGRMLLRSGMPATLYAELPYCVLHGWPTWVDGRDPDPHRNVDAFWMSFLEDVPELPDLRSAQVFHLDPAAASCKLAAMRDYRTQFACLDYGARGILSDTEIHGYEVRWSLTSPGPASDSDGAKTTETRADAT